jgi:hypothetical protein
MPIIPRVHEYKKMAPTIYPGFIESPIDVIELANKLSWAISAVKENRTLRNQIYDYEEYGKQFTVEEQFKSLLPKIEELL